MQFLLWKLVFIHMQTKLIFIWKAFALSLAFIMRFTATRKWPITCISLSFICEYVWPSSPPWLIKGKGYETWQTSLLYVFVCLFGIDPARTAIEFGMCWSNWPIETFLLRYSTLVRTLKQRTVQGRGPSNINCSTIIFVARFRYQSMSSRYAYESK